MSSALLVFCKWLEGTFWGAGVRTSIWAYPFIQLIHFSGLSIWLGTNIAVDLRLLGIGRRRRTAAQLSDGLFVWNWIGFCVVVLGGFLLFSASARTYATNPAFRMKLGILVPTAVFWHIVVQKKIRAWGGANEALPLGKLAGLIEIVLWILVVTAAVEIPNY
jgi:hypothetical protein